MPWIRIRGTLPFGKLVSVHVVVITGTVERVSQSGKGFMSQTHQEVIKVWIEPGCIVCDACETECPEVFEVQEETCIVRPEAEKTDFNRPLTPAIEAAAEGCPVDVIKFEAQEVEGPEPWAAEEAEET